MSTTHLAAISRRQVCGGKDKEAGDGIIVSVIFGGYRLSVSDEDQISADRFYWEPRK
jgi:hypothetical protein